MVKSMFGSRSLKLTHIFNLESYVGLAHGKRHEHEFEERRYAIMPEEKRCIAPYEGRRIFPHESAHTTTKFSISNAHLAFNGSPVP